MSLMYSIVGLLREQRLRIFRIVGGLECGQYHHKRILEAIQRHDPQGARAAMQAHLSQVREHSRNTQGDQTSGA
jgi:DNA-binding FadR family transcriptional regulator